MLRSQNQQIMKWVTAPPSAVVLAGALLEQAESLLLQEVHPTVIVDGYRKAANKAKQYIKEIADQVIADDKSTLLKIAKTSMQTKLVRKNSDQLADMVVKSVLAVAEKDGSDYTVDIDDIKVEKKIRRLNFRLFDFTRNSS